MINRQKERSIVELYQTHSVLKDFFHNNLCFVCHSLHSKADAVKINLMALFPDLFGSVVLVCQRKRMDLQRKCHYGHQLSIMNVNLR